jgi:hypothetical protein
MERRPKAISGARAGGIITSEGVDQTSPGMGDIGMVELSGVSNISTFNGLAWLTGLVPTIDAQ